MASRYDNKEVALNNSEMYKKQFDNRGVKFIRQLKTPTMSYPSVEDQSFLDVDVYVWKMGDRFYKLSSKYYGNPTYWWLIAWYNQTPTESHLAPGAVIEIPLPFERAMALYTRSSS
jgi:nucleoid-associated protein YgaU